MLEKILLPEPEPQQKNANKEASKNPLSKVESSQKTNKPLTDTQLLEEKLERDMKRIKAFVTDAKIKMLERPFHESPGEYDNKVNQMRAQIFQGNHCGNIANDILDYLHDNITNMVSPYSYTLYLQVLGTDEKVKGFNHARVMIGTPRGIWMIDGWKNQWEFHQTPKNNLFLIRDTVSSSLCHHYSLDPITSEIRVIDPKTLKPLPVDKEGVCGEGHDRVELKKLGRSKPFKSGGN